MKAPTLLQSITLRGHTFLPARIGPASTVIDLGANRGEFSQLVSQRFGARCIAVEANPDLAKDIKSLPKLESRNLAITGVDGEQNFNLSENPECSSVFEQIQQPAGKTVRVPTRTLETLLHEHNVAEVDLIKVDIEGAEVQMFASTPDPVLRRIGQITLEFHDFCGLVSPEQIASIRDRLRRLGFSEICFYPGNMNWLFVNRRLAGVNVLKFYYVKYLVRLVRLTLHRFRKATGIRSIGLSQE